MHTGHYDPLYVDNGIVSDLLSEARERLARRETRYVADEVAELMNRYDLPEESRAELAIGLLNVQVKSLETAFKRVQDGIEIDLDRTATELPVEGPARLEPNGRLLSDAWPPFVDLMVTEEGWRGQTESQNSTSYRMFIECCGDKPVGAYTRQDCARFYDLLRGLPALYSKKKEWRDLELAEIVERTSGQNIERLSMKTVSRHFSALGRLFDHFKRRGDFQGDNPAHGFQFPTKGRANSRRQDVARGAAQDALLVPSLDWLLLGVEARYARQVHYQRCSILVAAPGPLSRKPPRRVCSTGHLGH